jgi:hypothetical protein
MTPADPGPPADDGLQYDAFISYSRRNSEVADKLERDLETFPLPRDIRKRLGRRNAVRHVIASLRFR